MSKNNFTLIIILCVLFFVSSRQAFAQNNAAATVKADKTEAEKWREDLRYMAEQMPETHNNLFHTMSREQLDSAVKKLDALIPNLARHQIIVEMARITAMVGDGHSNVYPSREPKIGFRAFPGTFSAAQNLVNDLEEYTNTLFVGEQSGSKGNIDEKVTSEYRVTILPADKTVFVEAVIHGIKESDITGWEIGVAGRNPTVVTSDADGVRFAYSIVIPEQELSNSPDSALDKSRFRSWGSSIFAIPIIKKPLGRVNLLIRVPDGWSTATSFGVNQTRFVLESPEDFFHVALVAGDFRAVSFDAAGSPVYLAVRKSHPVTDAVFVNALKTIIETAVRYTGGKQPAHIMFGVDLLGEKKTYSPGNNVRTDSYSSTLLLDRSDADPKDVNFFGTYAHEFIHTWIPAVFGDRNVTRKELGSLFSEGFTDYIAYRVTHAAGLHSDEQFARALGKFYLEYLKAASSERTEKNAEFLKYRQGMMAAWVLDIELRRSSNGKNDFQKFIRMLVKQHANTGGLTKQRLIATLTTLGGADIVSLYERLMQPGMIIDVPLHMKSTGIQVRNVQNPAQELKELSSKSAPVVSFAPNNQKEREFLSGFLLKPPV